MLPNIAIYTLADSILVVNTDKMIPLKKFAEANQIGYRTAYRHWQNGLLEGVKLPTGTILIKGWKSYNGEKESKENECIILIRSLKEEPSEEISRLTDFAKTKQLTVTEIIIWKGYVFQPNPHIKDIIQNGVKNIVTNKISDIYGINATLIEELLSNQGINSIALEESNNIEISVRGLISSSSKMAKDTVGMHKYKKDIAHYIDKLVT